MVQRRGRRALRRSGLVGTGGALALVTLACIAAVSGTVWRQAEQGVVVERSSEPVAAAEDAGAEPTDEAAVTEAAEPQEVIVHVDGAVGAAGVVRLEGDDLRVFDAVEAAGGLLEDADTSGVNLAEPLADGAKIHIPHEGEQPADGGQEAGQAVTVGATGSGQATTLVNLNTADASLLQSLPGVGEVTARAIVEERERNGPYASIEDLMRVSGIGEKRFERLRDLICV